MAHSSERLTKAGDFNLDICEILSYTISGGAPGSQQPFRVNIIPIIASIELEEGIFQHTMSGKIQVFDTKDVRSVFPITGLEKLNLKFHTPGLSGICAVANEGHPFHIYKIETVAPNPKAIGAGNQAYDIYFCSRESYFNNFRKVSKAYDGPLELGVNDIFTNTKYLNSRKQLYIEPTRVPTKIVVPNLKPFAAIDMLARKAVSKKYNNAGYLFYETKEGYQFRSIESLLAVDGAIARPAKWNYFYGMQNVRNPHTDSKEIITDMHQVSSWNLLNPVDILNNLNQGAYASKLIEHDMFNKTINTTEYDYDEDFYNHFHTEHSDGFRTAVKTPLPRARFEDTFKTLSESFDQKVMLKSSTSAIHDNPEQQPISDRHTTQKAMSQRQLLTNGILEFTAPGNSLIQAGDIIKFDMPLMESGGHNKKPKSNPYWSGRYLIYSMKHMIDRGKGRYTIAVRAVKDNVAQAYTAEQNSWTHMAPKQATHNLYDIDKELLGRIETKGQLDGVKLPSRGPHR